MFPYMFPLLRGPMENPWLQNYPNKIHYFPPVSSHHPTLYKSFSIYLQWVCACDQRSNFYQKRIQEKQQQNNKKQNASLISLNTLIRKLGNSFHKGLCKCYVALQFSSKQISRKNRLTLQTLSISFLKVENTSLLLLSVFWNSSNLSAYIVSWNTRKHVKQLTETYLIRSKESYLVGEKLQWFTDSVDRSIEEERIYDIFTISGM